MMAQSTKKGRLSPLGAAMAHHQVGRFAQAQPRQEGKSVAAAANAVRLATSAGQLGRAAQPMENGRRAENYRRQRGGLAPVLTDRQRRRLRKKRLSAEAGQENGR
jgi:hypothetical protein